MIGDDQRGWAWTRAVQGLPANEIHLCGDASALPLIKQMCDDMAEPLTVVHYNRFTDLEIQPRALEREYASVEPGDCVVAFSRRDIFDIKADIERRTNHKCCVIYGALPPEMRRHQAELFNEPNNGFDILVASDAVGMGLNLNIRRVIFHKVQKFEGKDSVQVSPSQIKQIAGKQHSVSCFTLLTCIVYVMCCAVLCITTCGHSSTTCSPLLNSSTLHLMLSFGHCILCFVIDCVALLAYTVRLC